MLAGARLLAAADETVPVWVVSVDLGGGTEIGPDDVAVRRVRFADGEDESLYYSAATDLPGGLVLNRSVGGGELLARSAVVPATERSLLQVPLEVEPNRVPPSVTVGSEVDVYVDDRGVRRSDGEGRALERVGVVEAPAYQEAFAVSGFRQIVVAVPEDRVEGFEALLAAMDDPVIRIVQRG
ncbi:hypothetical protein [Nocardioides sambongensis]|uniref:hypothetical protein n=1 Tax=Nocardioides sambongensis TaxID=2589074 RepID=UPI00112AD674|nr:hypothetical protein [Nocardioides sambongensis]